MILNMTGGGAPLNFKVVGGTAEPASPAENMIWVNTDAEITGWVFSPEEPQEASEGMVWIKTGLSSAVAFNALKKNAIQVYPISAKQYVSGAWVSKTAKTYQGGTWVNWWDGVLYDAGNTYDSVTGGYSGVGDYVSATNSDGRLELSVKTGTSAALITEKAIDLTDFKTLKITGNGTNSVNCFGGISEDRSASFSSTIAMGKQGTYTLDIAAINGLFYVGIMSKYGNKVYADKIWLER